MKKTFILGNTIEDEAKFAEEAGLHNTENHSIWYCRGELSEWQRCKKLNPSTVELELIDIRKK